ncbi:hypothetical protein D8Y23_06910 [Microbacterium enclense]|uniref:2-oxoglutarate dehydrogenase n=1 Tax=Microbacterium enclense TaxID=993073 RepID=A0A3S3MDQ1_9MICO|nr:DUF6049 family protein [Microbacterium enclense]RWR19969.1 hypothetical protein D8Y23_06910 [Microbacterium enclense]
MTVTSQPSGSPVPRRPLTRRLLATLAAVALAIGLATPSLAVAATSTPSPSATASSPSLAAAPAGNGILRPGEALTVLTTLANPGGATVSSRPATLSIGSAPLADDASLTRWLGGDTSGVTLQQVATGTLDATAPTSQTSVTFTVQGTDPALAGRAAGVYPVLARTNGEAALEAPTVVVIPADGATTPLAVVVPITAAPRTRGLLTANELAELTAVDGPLSAQLDAVDGSLSTLAVDPAIPAAIRVLGSAAPPTAVAWLQRLLALPNDRFALQFGDADLSAQIHAGVSTPLAPTSLQSYMSANDFTQEVATVATPRPTSSSEPGQPAFPDLGALLDIGTAAPNVFWPATGSVDGSVVSALGALGTDAAPTRILVSSGNLTESPPTASTASSGVATAVYDAEISRALTTAAGENDTARRGAALAAVSGHLAFARTGSPDRPVLAVLDRGTDRSRVSLRATQGALASTPGYTPTTFAAIASAPRSDVSIADAAPDSARAADVAELLTGEKTIDRFATILDQPELLTGRERAEVLQVLNVAWTGDAARTAVADHRAATQTTLDSVGILSSDFRLVSSSAPLRPWVRNDLPWPITVELRTQPDDVRLRVEPSTPINAQASANTRVEVPVEARIANGEVTVGMQLYSPTGEPIGARQNVSVEVRAEWESIGLIVFIALVAAFLGIGVVRTVASRRRARAAMDGAASSD